MVREDRPDDAQAQCYPLVDTVLAGRYLLQEPLGRGGVADVYRALDSALHRQVAVKVFRPGAGPGGGPDLTEQRRFEREGRTLAGLHHAHLVALYDAGIDGDRAYLVLRLVAGTTLNERLGQGALPPLEVARIGASLADALSYVHGHKVVHRDVKPSNVLLAEDGGVYLTDFGIARMVEAPALTATGLLVGTAAYLAPEQVAGGEVEPPSDVYALGLVLLECLSGQRVYRGSVTEVAVARLSHRPSIPDELGSEWHALLTAMTAQDPANRPSARVVAGQLGRLALVAMVDTATAAGTPAPAADPVRPDDAAQPVLSPAPAADRNRRRRFVLALACAGLLGVAATVALTAGSAPDRTPPQDRVQEVQEPRSSDPTSRLGEPDGRSGTKPGGRSEGSEFGSTQPRGVAPGATILPPTVPVGGSATPSPPQSSESAGTPGPGDNTGDGKGKGKGSGKGKDRDRDSEDDPLVPRPTLPPVLG